jgi:hypothetical protein
MKNLIHYARILDDLLLNLFSIIKQKIGTIVQIITQIPVIFDYAKHVDELSSYRKDMRKSRKRILFENLLWAIKFGEINSYYFQYLFDRKHDAVDQSEYMPFRLYHRLRKKFNRGVKLDDGFLSYICILRDKYIFRKFVTGLSLPTPEVVAIYDNGKINWIESRKVEDAESLFQYEDIDFFCKDITGQLGTGVFHITIVNEQLLINGRKSSLQDLKKLVASKSIFEKRIIQHHKMGQLHSSSVNTIRIGTFNNGNNVTVFNAILKLGASGNVCDNWHFGGIIVGIDINTGNLMRYGIQPTKCANKLTKHPDSNLEFDGFKIPFFQDALRIAKILHSELYGVYTVGWDIAITENGPVVIEGNDNWDFRMFQVYYGGCKISLLELFNEH